MNKIIYYIDVLLAHNVSEEFTYKHETIEKPRVGMIVLAPLRSGEKIGVITKVNSVLNDSKKLLQITDKVYSIGSKSNEIANLSYVSLNSPELDSILIMCKFYPWIIKYSKLKKLDPDNPRYLTKITHTL